MHASRMLKRDVCKSWSIYRAPRKLIARQRYPWNIAKMSASTLAPIFQPPVNRDMLTLDRTFFQKEVLLSAITVFEPKQLQDIKKQLIRSKEIFSPALVRPIQNGESGTKCILLDPQVKVDDPQTWSELLSKLMEDKTVEIRPFRLNLNYDHWSTSDILDAVLPEFPEDDEEGPSGYNQVGHVAHMNLREKYLPYKHLIGQVLIDKNATVKTVINKTLDVGSESAFRTFPYEVLAGPNDMNVIVHSSGCVFHFNYAHVYWNTRLGHEHERICALFQPGEAVCDVMAGVGPFAIPAGKKGVWVRANDLNPACHRALLDATALNHVEKYVQVSCLDGRQFIKKATAELAQSQRSFYKVPSIKISRDLPPEETLRIQKEKQKLSRTIFEPNCFDHYVMNLPATAVEFLDAFKGLFRGREAEFTPNTKQKLPFIHVYLFQPKLEAEEMEREALERISRHIGAPVTAGDPELEVNVRDVRLVAPNKKFLCASFRLPASVAFADSP